MVITICCGFLDLVRKVLRVGLDCGAKVLLTIDLLAINPPLKRRKININNVKALKIALKKGKPYVATTEKLENLREEAVRVQKEARTLNLNKDYLTNLSLKEETKVFQNTRITSLWCSRPGLHRIQ